MTRAVQISWAMSQASPSPSGRRWPEGPDEGRNGSMLRLARPHPAFGHPLPEGEGSREKPGLHFLHWVETCIHSGFA